MALGRIREITFDDGAIVDGDDVGLGDLNNPIALGDKGLEFDTTSGLPTLSPWKAGVQAWDTEHECLAVSTPYEGSWIQLGQEMQDTAVNKSGGNLVNGDVVYIGGATGHTPEMYKASCLDSAIAKRTIGIVTTDSAISNNADGLVCTSGHVHNLNTSAYADGDIIYLSTTSGQFTKTKPSNEYDHIMVGIVLYAHNNQGVIYVDVRQMTDDVAKAGYFITDPHGWTVPDDTYALQLFNETTREVLLTPTGSSVPYYHKGELKTFTGDKYMNVDTTAGNHFICFNCTTKVLEDLGSTFPTSQLVSTHIFVAHVYIDDTGAAILMANERHSTRFTKRDWLYKHKYFATRYESGMAVTITAIDGNGSLDNHARFAIASGTMEDEDIPHSITGKISSGSIYKFYKTAGGIWKRATGNDSASGVLNGANGRAAYNPISGGLTECTSNNFVLAHVFAMNNGKYAVIVGQNEYSTIVTAKAAAQTELTTLVLSGLPSQEFVAVCTILYKTSTNYANTSKSAIISIDTGVSFVDWRKYNVNSLGFSSSGSAGTSATSVLPLFTRNVAHPAYSSGNQYYVYRQIYLPQYNWMIRVHSSLTPTILKKDLSTWFSVVSFPSNVPQDIAFSPTLGTNGRLVVVSINGTNNNFVTSDDGGLTWTARDSTNKNFNWTAVCWAPSLNLFCAVNTNGTSSQRVATSPDGITWTLRTLTGGLASAVFYDICWSEELSLFVGVCQNTNLIATSPDGINWTQRAPSSGTFYALYSVAWSPTLGLFVIGDYNSSSTHMILTSPDGINWTPRMPKFTESTTNTSRGIAHRGIKWIPELNVFVASAKELNGYWTQSLFYSYDGINWTYVYPANYILQAYIWGNPEYIPTANVLVQASTFNGQSNNIIYYIDK